MLPSDFQGGGPFGPPDGSFGGGFGSEPPSDDMFGQMPMDEEFGFIEQELLKSSSRKDVIGIGLHFHEKLRKMK